MLLPKCVVCDSKKLKFIKEQEASGLLSSSEINTPLNKITSDLACVRSLIVRESSSKIIVYL